MGFLNQIIEKTQFAPAITQDGKIKLKSGIEHYINEFLSYNQKLKLSASKINKEELLKNHTLDSFLYTEFIIKLIKKEFEFKKNPAQICIFDLGSGGGFPAVIFSIIFKYLKEEDLKLKITASDNNYKKVYFLDKIKSELNLNNLCNLKTNFTENIFISDIKKNIKNLPDNIIFTSRAALSVNDLIKFAEFIQKNLRKKFFFTAVISQKQSRELKAKSVFKKVPLKICFKNNYFIDKNNYFLYF